MQKLFEKVNIQKAILFLAVLLILIILVELKYFISGLLGAITLYVLTRKFYLRLVEEKKRNKNLSIALIIFLIIITFAIYQTDRRIMSRLLRKSGNRAA